MLTSLYGGGSRKFVDYYMAADDKRVMYCDAMTSAEASSKYILANHHIDEIITLGSTATYDPGDEIVQMVLREGSTFYASDTADLSAYSLLRYRLAQYIDEIRIEEQDLRELISEEEQESVTAFLRNFFREHVQPRGDVKFNRLFDIMMGDEELRRIFEAEVESAHPEFKAHRRRYGAWIRNYLYSELKDTLKLELLPGNENVKIRFIPTDGCDSLGFAQSLSRSIEQVVDTLGSDIELDLYICIQSEDANDTEALMNFMDIAKTMPNSRINIKQVANATRSADGIVNTISDSTGLYGVSDLLAGSRSFLKYGKTDLLMEYWKKQNINNDFIERLLYAMRNIDYGISLCDISDIERGMNSLRRLFKEGNYEPGDNIAEQYFALIVEAIKQDYGVLVTGDRIEFIDLVKWAYRKGFWQQTLTLIESRAPDDFVDRGIYYYCDSEEHKQDVIKKFGQIYFDFKPFEKYKMDDLSHYFIKFYGRGRVGYVKNDDQHLKIYTEVRKSDLDTDDPSIIKAYTVCQDKDALSSLLYEYYRLGFVRNLTNHASSDDVNRYATEAGDSDVSERMSRIRQSVEGFIYQYDRVTEAIKNAGAHAAPVYVGHDEIKAYANTLKPWYGNKDKDKKKDRDRDRDPEKDKDSDKGGGAGKGEKDAKEAKN